MKWQRQYWGVMKFLPAWFLRTQATQDEVATYVGAPAYSTVKLSDDRIYVYSVQGVDDWHAADEKTIGCITALDYDGDLIWEKYIVLDETVLPSEDYSFYGGVYYQNRFHFHVHPTEENHLLIYLRILHIDVDDEDYLRWLMLELDEDGDIIKTIDLGVGPSNTYDPFLGGYYGTGTDPGGGVHPISNGDAWFHVNEGDNRGYVALLDYSGNYTSTALSLKVDKFDDTPETEEGPSETRIEDRSSQCALSDDSFVVFASGQTFYDPAVIAKVTTGSVVTIKDMFYEFYGSGTDDWLQDNIFPGDGCFYTVLRQAAASSQHVYVLTRWNNDLTEDWSILIQNWRVSASGTALWIATIQESPDGQYVYIGGYPSGEEYGETGGFYGATLDITDGSVVSKWLCEIVGPSALEEVSITDMTAGDDFLVLGGYFQDSSDNNAGYCVAKVPQKLFDQSWLVEAARAIYVGKFIKRVWPSSPFTTSSISLTINTLSNSTSAFSISPSNSTEGLIDRTDDAPSGFELVRTFATKYFWGGH